VRERDRYQCQGCGLSQEDHLKQFGQKLCVHHITPAREFDDPTKRNAEENLISLCVVCHPKWEHLPGLRPQLM
jgi:5-methylcytosine-specific restriction endonuclease McrA